MSRKLARTILVWDAGHGYILGGGKTVRIIIPYQLCGTKRRRTREKTVWDQHERYFEAWGEIRNPRAIFKLDLLSLLRRWGRRHDSLAGRLL